MSAPGAPTGAYAAASRPNTAQTAIQTPVEGLDAGLSSVQVEGFSVPLYYAAPHGKSGLPVVLVVQEIFGLHAYIADICRRLAHAGYLAVAPALYARQGDASQYTDMAQLMADIVSKVPDAQVMADLDAAVQWAGSHGGDLDKLGVTGFCWGGRITWLYAAHSSVPKAGVAWYGRLAGVASDLTPRHPVDLAPDLKAPVLGLYGGQDAGIPMSQVAQMQAALAQAGAQGHAAAQASTIVVYPDAPHAFHADYRPSYRHTEAEDGFQRMLAWFKTQGVA